MRHHHSLSQPRYYRAGPFPGFYYATLLRCLQKSLDLSVAYRSVAIHFVPWSSPSATTARAATRRNSLTHRLVITTATDTVIRLLPPTAERRKAALPTLLSTTCRIMADQATASINLTLLPLPDTTEEEMDLGMSTAAPASRPSSTCRTRVVAAMASPDLTLSIIMAASITMTYRHRTLLEDVQPEAMAAGWRSLQGYGSRQ